MRMLCLALAALLAPLPSPAQDVAGRFDYYILALSWQPAWCSATGDSRGAPECRQGTARGFTVHGLWPQHERGWPQNCASRERDPARRDSAAMGDIMSPGLAWYQWQKHGRCSGLPAQGYYAATRDAWQRIAIPPALDAPPDDLTLSPATIEAAFIEANPTLTPDGVTVTCRDGALTEIRICLTRDLEPRTCAPDARRDCPLPRLLIEAPR